MTVASDRIARAFNRSGATGAVALDISKAFGRVSQVCIYDFLMMLSVILVSILMILLLTLNVIRHLIYGSN